MDLLAELPHDTARRFAVILALANQLEIPEKARILDVGGHPGTLARLLHSRHSGWSVHTVDTIESDAHGYTRATGARLPFPDAEFDLVVSSDTLEHVPPADRDAFLTEACRVCRGPVLIGAPFHDETVVRAESLLAAAHSELIGRAHPWLAEHVANGLPSLAESVRSIPRDRRVALAMATPLADWITWQWGALLRDANGALDAAWGAYNAQLAARAEVICSGGADARDEFQLLADGVAPPYLPYRYVLIAQPVEAATLPIAHPPGPECFCETERQRCDAQGRLLHALALAMRQSATPSDAHAGINHSLVQALQLAEQDNAVLQGRLHQTPSGSRWRNLFGSGGK